MTAIEDSKLDPRMMREWNAASATVEAYFNSLGVRNPALRGELVSRVLDCSVRRAEGERQRPPIVIAVEEMDRMMAEWFAAVLGETGGPPDPLLMARGRLALLLAGMPERWQEQFLSPAPWPEEFVNAMRKAYMRAGPDFQFSQMSPRPIDLGPMTTLAKLGNLPYFRVLLFWLLFALLLGAIFGLTH
jgi:hypothetical protein